MALFNARKFRTEGSVGIIGRSRDYPQKLAGVCRSTSLCRIMRGDARLVLTPDGRRRGRLRSIFRTWLVLFASESWHNEQSVPFIFFPHRAKDMITI